MRHSGGRGARALGRLCSQEARMPRKFWKKREWGHCKRCGDFTINGGDFLVRRAKELFDIGTVEGKARASAFLYPYADALDIRGQAGRFPGSRVQGVRGQSHFNASGLRGREARRQARDPPASRPRASRRPESVPEEGGARGPTISSSWRPSSSMRIASRTSARPIKAEDLEISGRAIFSSPSKRAFGPMTSASSRSSRGSRTSQSGVSSARSSARASSPINADRFLSDGTRNGPPPQPRAQA